MSKTKKDRPKQPDSFYVWIESQSEYGGRWVIPAVLERLISQGQILETQDGDGNHVKYEFNNQLPEKFKKK